MPSLPPLQSRSTCLILGEIGQLYSTTQIPFSLWFLTHDIKADRKRDYRTALEFRLAA